MKKFFLGLFIGIIISGVAVYAKPQILASSIKYDGSSLGLKDENGQYITNAKDALDILMKKASNVHPKMSDMCPGCMFSGGGDNWEFGNDATPLTDNQVAGLKNHWEDAIMASDRKIFVGLKINQETKAVEKLYSCALVNDFPFCIEGTADTSIYQSNKLILENIYGKDKCSTDDYGTTYCQGEISSYLYRSGDVSTNDKIGRCSVYNGGTGYCY